MEEASQFTTALEKIVSIYFSIFILKPTVVISSMRKPQRITKPKVTQNPCGPPHQLTARKIPKRNPHRIPWGAQWTFRLLTPIVNPIMEWWIKEETPTGQKDTPTRYFCRNIQTIPKITPQTVVIITRLFFNFITSSHLVFSISFINSSFVFVYHKSFMNENSILIKNSYYSPFNLLFPIRSYSLDR